MLKLQVRAHRIRFDVLYANYSYVDNYRKVRRLIYRGNNNKTELSSIVDTSYKLPLGSSFPF